MSVIFGLNAYRSIAHVLNEEIVVTVNFLLCTLHCFVIVIITHNYM